MATTEQFSLRWNNFHSNLTSGFHELFQANDMVDVTLSVEGKFLQAHKLVLSICSPFFKQLFKMNPCKHPVVILKDVVYGNLKDIIEFMYLGEVNVLRDNLTAFLRTAELLQVKGLTGDDSSDTSSKKGEDKPESVCDSDIEQDMQQFNQVTNSSQPAPAPPQHFNPQSTLPSSPTNNVKRLKSCHPDAKRVKSESVQNNSYNKLDPKSAEHFDENSVPEFVEAHPLKTESVNDRISEDFTQSKDEPMMDMVPLHDSMRTDQGRSDKGSYRCPSCSKRFTRRDHLRTHEKNIHGEDAGPFACVICAQLYKNSESLRKHVAKFHMFRVHEKNESCLKGDADSNFERIL